MPLYEYRCSSGHTSEHWWHLAVEAPAVVVCEHDGCRLPAKRIVSMPIFAVAERDPQTGLKIFKGNPFEGTPLEDSDGINPRQYRSTKSFIELKDDG